MAPPAPHLLELVVVLGSLVGRCQGVPSGPTAGCPTPCTSIGGRRRLQWRWGGAARQQFAAGPLGAPQLKGHPAGLWKAAAPPPPPIGGRTSWLSSLRPDVEVRKGSVRRSQGRRARAGAEPLQRPESDASPPPQADLLFPALHWGGGVPGSPLPWPGTPGGPAAPLPSLPLRLLQCIKSGGALPPPPGARFAPFPAALSAKPGSAAAVRAARGVGGKPAEATTTGAGRSSIPGPGRGPLGASPSALQPPASSGSRQSSLRPKRSPDRTLPRPGRALPRGGAGLLLARFANRLFADGEAEPTRPPGDGAGPLGGRAARRLAPGPSGGSFRGTRTPGEGRPRPSSPRSLRAHPNFYGASRRPPLLLLRALSVPAPQRGERASGRGPRSATCRRRSPPGREGSALRGRAGRIRLGHSKAPGTGAINTLPGSFFPGIVCLLTAGGGGGTAEGTEDREQRGFARPERGAHP
ncbi:translation initiation factor IF-2-like [Sphaerodactylus townsendi]|uniref:translation initiation factor IF-2-like n=1 Tax=Sphaerodactylus townsendi TaxID=933632 RepID=UPI0020260F8B|nr:translation initiation factor IF-2-like [Sphaerodactylus townsendi]